MERVGVAGDSFKSFGSHRIGDLILLALWWVDGYGYRYLL